MKVLFFAGKGGVGKSTLAAHAAWQLSENSRVHLISLDPAHNLGDIFHLSVGNKGTWISERLLVEEVDVRERTRSYLSREIALLKETYSYLQVFDFDRYFALLQYSPGIEEYTMLAAMEETIRESQTFDYLIFDTPPTGLTLRFLALPCVTLTWIKHLLAIRHQIIEKRETISRLSGTGVKTEEASDAIMCRLKELKGKYEGLIATLGSETCGCVVIFNPDVLSVKEAERLLKGLKIIGIGVKLCIQNKVRGEDASLALQAERELKAWIRDDIPFLKVRWEEGMLQAPGHKPYRLQADLATPLSSLGET